MVSVGQNIAAIEGENGIEGVEGGGAPGDTVAARDALGLVAV
nr:hypothetical protein [Mesorhizobium zhangyense]